MEFNSIEGKWRKFEWVSLKWIGLPKIPETKSKGKETDFNNKISLMTYPWKCVLVFCTW